MTSLLLALEGGGTRSQAALVEPPGRVLALVEAGDVNTNFTAFEKAQEAVRSAVSQALAEAGASGEQVSLLVSSLVGPRFGAETFGGVLPRARFAYYGERDVVFARAGVYEPHGVALVAATGATAFAVRADDGRERSFGGWGSLLGDEGSAYALGLAGLRAAVRAYEEREAPTGLVDATVEHFGVSRADFFDGLVRLAYHKPLSRAEIGAFAARVTALAAAGDAVAARLCAETAGDLAALALHACRSLFTTDEAFVVAAAGGLTRAGRLLLGPLELGLAREFPLARLVVGGAPPAVALGLLAIHHGLANE